jgi:hypothetical protein
MEVLGTRALNRATLDRQWLLRRERTSPLAAVSHLVGMQAQAPDAPYVGLWTRLLDFDPSELAGLLTSRRVVRTWLMRSTVHLVTDEDCLALRPLLNRVLERGFGALDGLDRDGIEAAGRALMAERPRTRNELGRLLGERFPGQDPTGLAFAASYLTAAVQVPPRGVWRVVGPAALVPADSWLGRPFTEGLPLEELVRRYLAAYGPALVPDMQMWCGLTRMGEVFARMDLRTFHDENGRVLYDLPDAPRPSADVEAPPRFLPEYDNLLLSHADRTRFGGRRVPLPPGNGGRCGTLLDDGFYRADWEIVRTDDAAVLHVRPFSALSSPSAIVAEGLRLLAFAAPSFSHEVRIDEFSEGLSAMM